MSRFIEGQKRTQATLLPDILDDYVTEENSVRVIDAFVDSIDLSNLGFKTIPEKTGRPSYHPSTMLKLYIYGYLNRVQSSRRLEKESIRNVELMWLLNRLTPDFKTIADFRKNNTTAIRKVCREFIQICKKLNLFSEALVAIDGSKFKAVNNRDKNYTRTKVKARLAQIDTSIDRYLKQLSSADRHDTPESQKTQVRLQEKIEKLKSETNKLNEIQEQLETIPQKQISLTDPDARSMATTGKGTGIVGYNVQSAVDAKHHIIVHHEVTNICTDRSQLSHVAKKTKDVMAVDELTAVADRGYYSGEEIKVCSEANIKTYLPKPQTSGSISKGLFSKRDFIYKQEADEYECPAGYRAIFRGNRKDRGKPLKSYWSSECIRCSIKRKCTTSKYRRIDRWEHETILDEVELNMERNPEMMKIRRSTVEHPFATLKMWMGYSHFQMRTLKRVSAEMSLHVLAYNLKRVMNIMGAKALIEAIQV